MDFVRVKKPGLSLDMAPLIDIVFQLLIFFMLSSSFMSPMLRLNLPKAVTDDKVTPQAVNVSIKKDGELFVDSTLVAIEQFKDVLNEKLAGDPARAVHLQGDRDMPYRFFVEAMDAARQAGARQINIVHESGEAS